MSYNTIPNPEVIEQTKAAIEAQNIKVIVVNNKEEVLAKIKELIPSGVSVMTGGSTTLDQIGFTDLLKSGNHPWNNLKAGIMAETDLVKQGLLRKQAVLADYFLGSVHAIAQTGELLVASGTGSQLPAYTFTSDNVIWVAGAHKIVPTVEDCYKRLNEYVFPLEDERMKKLGMAGGSISMTLLFQKSILPNRKLTLILVKEVLGF
ncbi:MAG: lactate utilization protein [Candidatus Komeilibacteria bacterium]|nr:lactate utilization protein [Candidatus Komeilibacteria bacterium]